MPRDLHAQLLERVEALTDDRRYSEMPKGDLLRLSDGAALFEFGDEEVWLPYSQLRASGGTVYASDWILKQKGID